MRVLIIPMSAMAETAGSFSRTILLTDALKEANIDTAVCFAKDVNYKPINHVKCYFLSVPMPLGLPIIIATHTFPMAQKLGITNRKSVNSFDEVLHLTGNTDYKYLKNAYDSLFKTKQKMEDRSNRDAAAIRYPPHPGFLIDAKIVLLRNRTAFSGVKSISLAPYFHA